MLAIARAFYFRSERRDIGVSIDTRQLRDRVSDELLYSIFHMRADGRLPDPIARKDGPENRAFYQQSASHMLWKGDNPRPTSCHSSFLVSNCLDLLRRPAMIEEGLRFLSPDHAARGLPDESLEKFDGIDVEGPSRAT